MLVAPEPGVYAHFGIHASRGQEHAAQVVEQFRGTYRTELIRLVLAQQEHSASGRRCIQKPVGQPLFMADVGKATFLLEIGIDGDYMGVRRTKREVSPLLRLISKGVFLPDVLEQRPATGHHFVVCI